MEKRKLKRKDTPKMDSLLPPTQRTAQTMPTVPDKKKDKKWSLGSLLKKISSIRDYESSSNEDDIVFCKRQPKNRASMDRTDGIVLRPVQRNSQKKNWSGSLDNNVGYTPDALVGRRDSRCSDGSLDGLGRKLRKNKVKARVEAKRDRLCGESSSDDDSRKSNSSLSRTQGEDCSQNGQKPIPCHRKTRTARTERYLKRFSKDDAISVDETISAEIPARSGRVVPHSSNRFLPKHQSSMETMHDADPTCELLWCSKYMDLNQNDTSRKPYSPSLGEENPYGKIRRNGLHVNPINSKTSLIETSFDGPMGCRTTTRSVEPPTPPPRDPRCRIFTYGCHSFPIEGRHRYDPRFYDQKNNGHTSTNEIVPARRTPLLHDSSNEIAWQDRIDWTQSRPVSLNSGLSAFSGLRETGNDKYNSLPRVPRPMDFKRESEAGEKALPRHQRASSSFDYDSRRFRDLPCTFNNKYSTKAHEHTQNARRYSPTNNETEIAKCQRRNDRNNRLNLTNSSINDTADYRIVSSTQNKLTPCTISNPIEKISPYTSNGSLDRFRMSSPPERYSRNTTYAGDTSNSVSLINDSTTKMKSVETKKETGMERNGPRRRTLDYSETVAERRRKEMEGQNTKETMERKRSSKNLEEALSELEAIYNSLHLGDEDLLDRAERRSMQEYSLKQGVIADEPDTIRSPDSPDRTKDDMAYRRMNPRERPSSLSDCIVPLSNISYLMTSPVLSRKDDPGEHLRSPSLHRDEPDVMLDDVVFRSINRANNTLKVIEPQPPFGIPLGPVTTAAESDYLHTTPKLDQPRSSYLSPNEPDVVTDDLAFRALRKDAGATKGSAKYQQDLSRSPVPSSRSSSALGMIDQQPPFGIPIGPVVAAPETDYLHALPSKPDAPRSPYLPQSQPDLVTDDLAYRSLRKDVGLSKNGAKEADVRSRSPSTAFTTKKKRAVRSLSANLYGLINQDRIHLHRQPSLSEIEDEFKDGVVNYAPGVVYPEYLRRVVSDGELSDQDCRWRTKNKAEKSMKDLKRGFDINGNQPAYVCQKKLQVYVSPTDTQDSGKDRESDSSVPTSTPSGNSLTAKTFGDEFWHDRQRSNSNISPSSRNSDRSVESDLTTYSRLCQDLADMIKWPEEETNTLKEDTTVKVGPTSTQKTKVNNDSSERSKIDEKVEDKLRNDQMGQEEKILSREALEPVSSKVLAKNDVLEPTILRIESLGSHYTKSDGELIETASIEKDPPTEIGEDSLDYYLRLADENVKLIAEAFSDVVDCLSDKHFSQSDALNKNSESQDHTEIKTDFETHATDEVEDCNSVFSGTQESVSLSNKDVITGTSKGQTDDEEKCDVNPISTAENDLSQAVHDLQVAAANLYGDNHMTWREKSKMRLTRNSVDNSEMCAAGKGDDTEDTAILTEDAKVASLLHETTGKTIDTESRLKDTTTNFLKCESKVEDVEVSAKNSTDDHESATCDATKHTDEKFSDDTTVSTTVGEDESYDGEEEIVVSSSVEERSVKRDSVVSGEGESTECEFHAKIHAFDGAGLKEMCVFCVTNPSATAYTVILLACFVALLLAILVAS